MRLGPALLPLRHATFRRLWVASVITWLGTWLQNTGAAWLMTSLAPNPLTVSLIQAATILPVFLLALPAGALADIVDRRLFLIGTQIWTMLAAGTLAALTLAHMMTASGLLALTFAIGIGSAMTNPAWGAIVPELVPREDLFQAIALNGIGFNIARAIGPALAGFLVLIAGSGVTFALFAASILAVILALASWQRRNPRNTLPREHLLSAMRAGMRFVRNNPSIRATMVRSFAFCFPAAAPWALLPLVVRSELGLGAGMYGLILGVMGAGGVTAGFSMPVLRKHADRGAIVTVSTIASSAGIAVLGAAWHWLPAAIGMLLFGLGWVAALSTLQAAAQLAAPPWVRARALAIYQLSFNGALVLGSFGAGWLATEFGLQRTLLGAAVLGLVLIPAVRRFAIDPQAPAAPSGLDVQPIQATWEPEAPAPELVGSLRSTKTPVLETMAYYVEPGERTGFLAIMAEVRRVRGRAGAMFWQLYEDVAHPNGWLEMWSVESWTDHLRETDRMSEEDRATLARAAAFRRTGEHATLSRYLAVTPHELARARPGGPLAATGSG